MGTHLLNQPTVIFVVQYNLPTYVTLILNEVAFAIKGKNYIYLLTVYVKPSLSTTAFPRAGYPQSTVTGMSLHQLSQPYNQLLYFHSFIKIVKELCTVKLARFQISKRQNFKQKHALAC